MYSTDAQVIVPDGQYFTLNPGQCALAITHERVRLAPTLCGLLEGRSRFARLGIFVHITASFMQPGINNQQVLEIFNASNVCSGSRARDLKLHKTSLVLLRTAFVSPPFAFCFCCAPPCTEHRRAAPRDPSVPVHFHETRRDRPIPRPFRDPRTVSASTPFSLPPPTTTSMLICFKKVSDELTPPL